MGCPAAALTLLACAVQMLEQALDVLCQVYRVSRWLAVHRFFEEDISPPNPPVVPCFMSLVACTRCKPCISLTLVSVAHESKAALLSYKQTMLETYARHVEALAAPSLGVSGIDIATLGYSRLLAARV